MKWKLRIIFTRAVSKRKVRQWMKRIRIERQTSIWILLWAITILSKRIHLFHISSRLVVWFMNDFHLAPFCFNDESPHYDVTSSIACCFTGAHSSLFFHISTWHFKYSWKGFRQSDDYLCVHFSIKITNFASAVVRCKCFCTMSVSRYPFEVREKH